MRMQLACRSEQIALQRKCVKAVVDGLVATVSVDVAELFAARFTNPDLR